MKIIHQVTRASARRPGRDTCKLRSPSTQAHLSITSRCDVLFSTYVHGMPERISSVKEDNKKTIGQMLLLQLEVGKTSCRVKPSSLVVRASLPTVGGSYLTIGASRTDSCSIYIRPVLSSIFSFLVVVKSWFWLSLAVPTAGPLEVMDFHSPCPHLFLRASCFSFPFIFFLFKKKKCLFQTVSRLDSRGQRWWKRFNNATLLHHDTPA